MAKKTRFSKNSIKFIFEFFFKNIYGTIRIYVLEMYQMPKFRDPQTRMHMRISVHENPQKRMHMQISKDGDPQMRISVQEDPRMRKFVI